jgi:hypothetical protein
MEIGKWKVENGEEKIPTLKKPRVEHPRTK